MSTIVGYGLLALAVALAPSTQRAEEWSVHRSDEFGYEIEHPAGWSAIESDPRPGTLHGMLIREPDGKPWPGEFEIRVQSRLPGRTLDEWADTQFQDVHDESLVTDAEEAVLSGHPARRFRLFGFDHTGIVVALAHDGRILSLRFAGPNPNDPDIAEHRRIYERMERSFRLIDD